MPPDINLASMRAGRDGSFSGTVAFSLSSCASNAPAHKNSIAILLFISSPSLACPMQANISIQRVETQLRSTLPGAAALQPIAAIYISALFPLGLDRRRPRSHVEVAIDLSVECLEEQVRRQRRRKEHVQLAV